MQKCARTEEAKMKKKMLWGNVDEESEVDSGKISAEGNRKF